MPPISETQRPLDPNRYVRVNPAPPADPQWTPRYNTNMRCPVPPTNFTPDSSLQFYRGATLPQFRAFTPQTLTGTGGGTSGGSVTNTSVTESTSTTNTVTLQAKMATVTTTVLNPGQNYTNVFMISRVFALIQVTATAAARIRVYATAAAQTADLSRPSSASPAYGTTQGLITDITLGTSPYSWLFTPMVLGANGSSPSTSTAYVTVGQLGALSGAITVTFTFLPLQS